ncbi:MAG: L-seryl-tRNA(Sec) selenium transferase [Candidatus Aminicenantes bacterium]|jgi:L-seryl-tRNA(Ser) seleniumtransferase
MNDENKQLRKLPGVDLVLEQADIKPLISRHGHELVTFAIREVISNARKDILAGKKVPGMEQVVSRVREIVNSIFYPSLKPVINATGIVLHTNLGRAPMGEKVLEDMEDIIAGYSNVEFDLEQAARGKRDDHVVSLLKYVTGAEDAVVVNNNAAGLMLALHTLAKDREVIISRGELIEIGGSFRLPEIMTASGARMKEVGTTNKTHYPDYENAINDNTALILKVHQSNYAIEGFTQEVPLKELVKLAHSRGLPLLYDIGSGLLRKPGNLPLENEPDVKTSLNEGADLVMFSGDKLLGGPQAGLVVGKKELISRLKKAPMKRALRVGKLTLAALSSVIRSYFDDKTLVKTNPLFSILEQTHDDLMKKIHILYSQLTGARVKNKIVESIGQSGGGSLPTLKIKSMAIVLVCEEKSQTQRSRFAEKVFHRLLGLKVPIVGILRQGEVWFDVLTIPKDQLSYVVSSIIKVVSTQSGYSFK